MQKIVLSIIFSSAIVTQLYAKPTKPISICLNINEIAAYEVASELVELCEGTDFNKIKKYLHKGIKEQNAFSCNLDCLLVSGTTDMESCVENTLVAPYVSAFMESTTQKDITTVCSTVKGW